MYHYGFDSAIRSVNRHYRQRRRCPICDQLTVAAAAAAMVAADKCDGGVNALKQQEKGDKEKNGQKNRGDT
jgi:ribosomal protein L37AE/L43A